MCDIIRPNSFYNLLIFEVDTANKMATTLNHSIPIETQQTTAIKAEGFTSVNLFVQVKKYQKRYLNNKDKAAVRDL